MHGALKNPPGPRPWPIIGTLYDLGGRPLLDALLADWRRYGDVTRYVFGRKEVVRLVHPEHSRHVLVKNRANYIKGQGVDTLRHMTGEGLFTADGELWQTQRRMMQPHFTVAAVRTYGQAMQGAIEESCARLSEQGREGASDMSFELMRFTMDVICRTMFSVGAGGEAKGLSEAITEAMHWTGARGTRLVQLPPRVPTPENVRFKRALVEIDRFLLGMIERRRASGELGQHGDLLDVLLQASDEETGRGMSVQQLRDEMVTVFLAGHETTAISLGWALYLLSQHRDAQELLHAEADALARDPTADDLAALPATRRVIEEALRLFPPVWINPRQALAEDEVDGLRIPAGAMVLNFAYATHRHPEFWADPERFDPDRFLPEQVRDRHPLAFMPFGGGHRVCIGMNFALQEMIMFVAALMRRFRVEMAPGFIFGFDVGAATLRSLHPLRMVLRPRA